MIRIETMVYDHVDDMDVRNTLLVALRKGDAAATELAALAEQVRELEMLLRRVQFVTDTDLNKYCPICENEIWHGHTPDCELARLLSAAPQPVDGQGREG